MKVLITGGNGFLGKRLVARLKKSDAEVCVLVRRRNGEESTAVYEADIRDSEGVSRVFEDVRPDWVFHLAADIRRGTTDIALFNELFETNVRGTLHVLSAAARVHASAFVYAGSFEEYGDAPTPFQEDGALHPASPYGVTKAMATLLISMYGKTILPATVLRFPVLFGEGGHTASFLRSIKESLYTDAHVTIPKERVEREFIYIEDAAYALIRAAERIELCRGEVINVCSGRSFALCDVVRMAEAITDRIIHIDEGPSRPFEQFSYVGSNQKAQRLLDFKPRVSFEERFRKFLLEGDSAL